MRCVVLGCVTCRGGKADEADAVEIKRVQRGKIVHESIASLFSTMGFGSILTQDTENGIYAHT